MNSPADISSLPRKPLPIVDAIVIGASAGGVEALLNLFAELPAQFRLPIIVVLHLPSERHSRLAEVFQQHVTMPVKEVDDKELITAGTLYFAAPGYHVSVENDLSLSLSLEDRVHHSRPSIDILFESAADAFGERLAGVLLTGANADGARGMAQIKDQGGFTLVQDPGTAQASTMPQAALALSAPDYILSLSEIGQMLVELERIAC